jgi:hypothetical protein
MELPDEDSLVTRDAMRTAVTDAKQAIQAAKAAGLEPEECERLLAEAIAASYRLDYLRARNLARKAETVALSFLERAAGEGRWRRGGNTQKLIGPVADWWEVAGGNKASRYNKSTIALWIVLGALITVTSILSLMAGGVEALYLVITGWIVGPFFIYWAYKKMKKILKG